MPGLENTLPKKSRVRAWGLVVGTPGGLEQKADGGPRERLERSLSVPRARTWAENNIDQRFASTRARGHGV